MAFCPHAERRRIIQLLRKRAGPQDWLAFDQGGLDAVLAETAARGYAARDASPFGGFDERPFRHHLDGIAVPITRGGRVHGCLNFIWVKRAARVQEMAERHLGDLKAAASEIAAAST
jgi:IclR family mhp operon transcriptional activator